MNRKVVIGLWCGAMIVATIGASRLAMSQSSRATDSAITINLTQIVRKLRGWRNEGSLSVQQRSQLKQTQQNVRSRVTRLLKNQPLLVLRMLVKSPQEAKRMLADFSSESPLTLGQEFHGIQLTSQQAIQIRQARERLREGFDRQVRNYPALPIWLIVLPDIQADRLYEQTLAASVKTYVDDVTKVLSIEQQQLWQQNWLQVESRLAEQ
ncbi:hypothetical protein ACQ4M3_10725 [Leptolyngbya sp. AN03gr2]|uniref:hypothetical protein n=1 Tax=unclassified Leptolyngbya TaxID=2650499 RepID=UPI003D318E4A